MRAAAFVASVLAGCAQPLSATPPDLGAHAPPDLETGAHFLNLGAPAQVECDFPVELNTVMTVAASSRDCADRKTLRCEVRYLVPRRRWAQVSGLQAILPGATPAVGVRSGPGSWQQAQVRGDAFTLHVAAGQEVDQVRFYVEEAACTSQSLAFSWTVSRVELLPDLEVS